MHHAYTQCSSVIRVMDSDGLPVHPYLALFRVVKAEQHAHEGTLARTVFTEQRMNLTAL